MRIVAVADTHLYHDELDVPAGDVFVHAGDLCRAGDLDELAVAVRWLAALPHRHKIVVAPAADAAVEGVPPGWVRSAQTEHAIGTLLEPEDGRCPHGWKL